MTRALAIIRTFGLSEWGVLAAMLVIAGLTPVAVAAIGID